MKRYKIVYGRRDVDSIIIEVNNINDMQEVYNAAREILQSDRAAVMILDFIAKGNFYRMP